MTDKSAIHPDVLVRDVIVSLLITALPPELRAAAPELAGRVAEHPEVSPHFGKRWGELTESQGNIIDDEAFEAQFTLNDGGLATCYWPIEDIKAFARSRQ